MPLCHGPLCPFLPLPSHAGEVTAPGRSGQLVARAEARPGGLERPRNEAETAEKQPVTLSNTAVFMVSALWGAGCECAVSKFSTCEGAGVACASALRRRVLTPRMCPDTRERGPPSSEAVWGCAASSSSAYLRCTGSKVVRGLRGMPGPRAALCSGTGLPGSKSKFSNKYGRVQFSFALSRGINSGWRPRGPHQAQ